MLTEHGLNQLFPARSTFPVLHTMALPGCRSLGSLDFIHGAPFLRELNICGAAVRDLQSIMGGCAGLETLIMSRCSGLTSLEGLEHCAALCFVQAEACPRLTSLEALSACPALRHLRMQGCSALADVTPLAACRGLEVAMCC